MTGLLDGKVAVVTGGASGNGRGVALALAQHGVKAVVVADMRDTPREGASQRTNCFRKRQRPGQRSCNATSRMRMIWRRLWRPRKNTAVSTLWSMGPPSSSMEAG